MDIMPLDENTFLPIGLLENYSSCIWTERELEPGDFQIKTRDIEATRELLPEGSFVAERGTDEVMIVTSHEISFNDDTGADELTVKGESFETYLRKRMLISEDYNTPFPFQFDYPVQTAAMAMIYNAVANPWTTDVLKGNTVPAKMANKVPNLTVVDATTPRTGLDPTDIRNLTLTQPWYGETGDVYKQVHDVLLAGELGIQTVRPPTPPQQLFRMKEDGKIQNVKTVITDSLQIRIFNGVDRSVDQSARPPIVFRYDAGHLQDTSVLVSDIERVNYLTAISSEGESTVFFFGGGVIGTPTTAGEPAGIQRLEAVFDVGTISPDVVDIDAYLQQKAVAELRRRNRLALFDGAITAQTPYKYRQDYYLGDTVTVVGNYGVTQSMKVVEYIRTEDVNGEKAYPTLVIKELEV